MDYLKKKKKNVDYLSIGRKPFSNNKNSFNLNTRYLQDVHLKKISSQFLKTKM